MRVILLALAMTLAAPELRAQDWQMPPADDAAPEAGEGFGGLLDNLLRQAQPQLDQLGRDMEGLANQFAPALSDIAGLIDDFRNYESPERLENGDILIRRKADAPPPPPVEGLRDLTRPPADESGDKPPLTDPDAPEYEL